jgi:hypothetical protein
MVQIEKPNNPIFVELPNLVIKIQQPWSEQQPAASPLILFLPCHELPAFLPSPYFALPRLIDLLTMPSVPAAGTSRSPLCGHD